MRLSRDNGPELREEHQSGKSRSVSRTINSCELLHLPSDFCIKFCDDAREEQMNKYDERREKAFDYQKTQCFHGCSVGL
jgi:hypothetical protein